MRNVFVIVKFDPKLRSSSKSKLIRLARFEHKPDQSYYLCPAGHDITTHQLIDHKRQNLNIQCIEIIRHY